MVKKLDAIKIYEIAESGNTGHPLEIIFEGDDFLKMRRDVTRRGAEQAIGSGQQH